MRLIWIRGGFVLAWFTPRTYIYKEGGLSFGRFSKAFRMNQVVSSSSSSSRIKSTDFSIAHILLTDNHSKSGTPNLQSPSIQSFDRLTPQQQDLEKLRDSSIQSLNQKKVSKYEEKKGLIEKYQGDEIPPYENDSTITSVSGSKSVPKMRTSDLTWLQYTRYSPPKLPRKSKSFIQSCTRRRIGHHPRIPFSSTQLQILENKYKRNAYLSRNEVVEMSRILRLPQNKIKIWFQNRRARQRRELLNSTIVTR